MNAGLSGLLNQHVPCKEGIFVRQISFFSFRPMTMAVPEQDMSRRSLCALKSNCSTASSVLKSKRAKTAHLGFCLVGGSSRLTIIRLASSADARYSSEADQANLMTDEVSSWLITLFRIFLPSMISKIDTVPSSKPQQ